MSRTKFSQMYGEMFKNNGLNTNFSSDISLESHGKLNANLQGMLPDL